MTDTATGAPHTARLMSGIPRTESGFDMPLANWYQLTPPIHYPGVDTEYIAVTNHGVYPCNSMGRLDDFVHCLYERPSNSTPADALLHLDGGYVVA